MLPKNLNIDVASIYDKLHVESGDCPRTRQNHNYQATIFFYRNTQVDQSPFGYIGVNVLLQKTC